MRAKKDFIIDTAAAIITTATTTTVTTTTTISATRMQTLEPTRTAKTSAATLE